MIMESPVRDRKAADIKATVAQCEAIIPHLLAAHTLSGCDTVGAFLGIGKNTVGLLKVLKSRCCLLDLLGKPDIPIPEVVKQASAFISECYGHPTCETTPATRTAVWKTRKWKSRALMPKQCSLPPTTEAFQENVKRADLQTAIWRAALDPDPPVMDPTEYGWIKHEVTKSLVPTTVPATTSLASQNILKLIKYSCASVDLCKCLKCGCHQA